MTTQAGLRATDRPGLGIALMLLATLVFAVGDLVTKLLTTDLPVGFVVAIRYLLNAALLLAWIGPRAWPALRKVNRPGLVLLRAASLATASVAMGHALRHMPLAETVAIVFLAPPIVMLLAIPVLGERPRLSGWVGAALGFAGILLIVRPGSGLSSLGVGFALIVVAATVAYTLLSRKLAGRESMPVLVTSTALFGAVLFGASLPVSWPEGAVSGGQWALLLALGGLATLGHVLFTRAFGLAPAATLAPFNNAHPVWAAGLGLLAFGIVPAPLTLAGIALVTVAGVLVALAGRKARTG